jgi:large subunit ribosomal protein L35
MPKMKSHSGAKKRFKRSATGKLRGKRANSSHNLEHKSSKRRRNMRKPSEISSHDAKRVNKMLGGKGR